MYRNVYYDKKNSTIHHWTWDADGSPYKKEEFFKPFLYLPSADPKTYDAVGIDHVPLIKKEFDYEWERYKFLKTCKTKVYFNLPPTQQYLLENYYQKDITELTQFPLRTFFIDIEVIADEFPKADEAKFPITSITIYDSETKKFQVWGTEYYDEYSCKDHLENMEPDEIVYNLCNSEKGLLVDFLKYWRKNFPDVVVGYNSYSFDMPYIVNRIEKMFGEGKSSKLSPVDNIYGTIKTNKYQQQYVEYTIGGIAHLDYMVLYKTFTPGERPSDALDYVCDAELGFGKLDYGDMSLQELYREDWNRFINYNIWDVKLLVLLDEHKKYLDIAKFSAFSGFCNLDKAFGKTSIITGVLAKQSMEKGFIIPTQTEGKQESIPGGYVKDIEPGLYEDIVSVDCNSLYPSNIITLNISPETKMAKIFKKNENGTWKVWFFNQKKFADLTKEQLEDLMRQKNWARSASGVFFDQSSMSVSASFCDSLYNKRKKVKDEMLTIEKNMEKMDETSLEYAKMKKLASQKDVEQYLYKILLNSTYGAFANRFFSLYDIDCAKAITMTGQAMIKKTEEIVNNFIASEWNLEPKDRVVGMDTDSALFTIKDICDNFGVKLIDSNGDLTPEFVTVENKITDHLNREIQLWAKDKLNSADPRYYFKRESVCPKAMWTGKKHYILYLVNKEGKKMDKFKYSGLSIAKSTFSDAMKQVTKDIVKIIMTNKDKKVADQLFYETYDKFATYPVQDVAERGSIKVLNKWEGKNKGLECAKGTTKGAKYSIYYNELLKMNNLENKYRKIENGSKIKMLYVKPNKYNIEGIAFQDSLPTEFDLEPDYHKMFYRAIIKALEPIYNALHWNVPDPKIQHLVTLDEIFG